MKRFAGWFGAIKSLQARLLADGYCVDVVNLRPGRGDLRPWKLSLPVATVGAAVLSIYRMGRDVASDSLYWLTSIKDVDYARAPTAIDPTERTYYTGELEPRWTNNVIGLAGAPYPSAYRTLGVPKPDTAPVAVVTTSGAGTVEDRFYVDIFVNDLGEKSAPNNSPSNKVSTAPSSTVTLNGLSAPPAGAHGITTRWIYRTVVATSGAADFFLVGKIPAGTATFVDNVQPNGELLESDGGGFGLAYEMPPANLRGITFLWNGMMGAHIGKSARISHAYKPHAWAPAFEAVANAEIVGTGHFGTTWVLLTTDRPFALSGSSPAAMVASMEPIKAGHACVAKRSITSFKHGVGWASARGAAYLGANGPQLLTQGVMLEEDWAALNPSTMIGCQYGGLWFLFYRDGANQKRGLILNPLAPAAIIFLDTGADAAWFDPVSENMYVLNGTSIAKWNAGAGLMTVSALSKIQRSQSPDNFGLAQIVADAYPVDLTIYGDGGVIRYAASVPSISIIHSLVPQCTQPRLNLLKGGKQENDAFHFQLTLEKNICTIIFLKKFVA